MSEVLQWPTPSLGSSVAEHLGAPPPPRLKPLLDTLPSRLGGDKGETASLTPPNLLAITKFCDPGSPSNGGPLSPTNGGPPPQFSTQPCLLANRYLVTRAIDTTTSEAIHLATQSRLLVKV